ncbi:Clp protease ClpP [Streptococcus suis]|nr:Clp protease ClpP [Streptococcus suis]NQJ76030.1 Clp protease ClpP [Streptococcus suis]
MKIVQIKGPIIPNSNKDFYSRWNIEATAPKDIILPDTMEDIEIHINSGGGSVFAGSEIFTALKSYPGKKVVKVVGLAASAASVIAMAGDVIEMSPTAQMMIHNVSSWAQGDSEAMYHEASVLEGMNQSIANAYIAKTGKSMDELLAMMKKTTWFTAQSAVEAGFADKVMFQDDLVPEFVASISAVIPQGIIDAFTNQQVEKTTSAKLDALETRIDAFEDKLDKILNKPIQSAKMELDASAFADAVKKALDECRESDSPFKKFI